MAPWLAQAQPVSEAGVQIAAMAEERQGTFFSRKKKNTERLVNTVVVV